MVSVEKCCGGYDLPRVYEGVGAPADERKEYHGITNFPPEAAERLRESLFETDCFAPRHKTPEEKQKEMLKTLYAILLLNPYLLPMIYGLMRDPGSVKPDREPTEVQLKPKVLPGDGRFVRQYVRVSTGEIIPIPVMMGSTTKVKILKNGDYAVTTKGVYLGAKEKTVIMSEQEFIDKYGK